MADLIHYILHNTKLNSAEICSVLLHPDCMLHLNQTMTKNIMYLSILYTVYFLIFTLFNRIGCTRSITILNTINPINRSHQTEGRLYSCFNRVSSKLLYFNSKVLWEIPLPERKEFKPLNTNSISLKMLHISDFHLDLWYTPGSNSVCSEPVCCRSTSPAKVNVSQRGVVQWSETNYSCDTPTVFTDTAFK